MICSTPRGGGNVPGAFPALLRAQANALEVQVRVLREQADAIETGMLAIVTALAPAATTPSLTDKRGIAGILAISPATVDRLDREGQPFVRVGDVKRYEIAAVMAWHRERSTQPAPVSVPRAAVAPKNAVAPSDPDLAGVRRLSR